MYVHKNVIQLILNVIRMRIYEDTTQKKLGSTSIDLL